MIGNLPTTEAALIDSKNRLVANYPSLREPINGFLRSALAEDQLAVIELQLISERQRLSLSQADVTVAIESAAVPTFLN